MLFNVLFALLLLCEYNHKVEDINKWLKWLYYCSYLKYIFCKWLRCLTLGWHCSVIFFSFKNFVLKLFRAVKGGSIIQYKSSSSSSSSSCRAASTDIPDPLSPLLPIFHRLWQVFRATSRILTLGRCPWCSRYRRRNWTRRHEFKSWTRLIAFHIALIPLGKVWIQLFSLQLWVNSWTD